MQAWLPTYFASELGLDMKASALFSALPFATMALGSLVSGQASAALLQRMAPFEVRKRMVALSSIVPACALSALSYIKSSHSRFGTASDGAGGALVLLCRFACPCARSGRSWAKTAASYLFACARASAR